ncbi:lasso peptide biosynthesis B2 protein [Parerythrobacter jejuensis]|uniref:Lasso peptide biosynthesis B2 protein n=1 Tax=Parerythrobacter jejuensis TaxID=795812 RepID=A0A845AT36_9SPHN|nr:lasso peptide biosynthesis B2 protein [Parerythrobacter jejuensis]MXP32001.1 lasso peptide biosynthesis B2 protein [Parerythrobacter jejuensis]
MGELALVPVALLLLGAARFAILIFPFRWYAWTLGASIDNQTAPGISPAQRVRARSIGRSVRASASVTPWQSVCLPQALAASVLLRAGGVPFISTFGLKPGDKDVAQEPMLAHAWITTGDLVVTGGPVDPGYRVVATFGSGIAG